MDFALFPVGATNIFPLANSTVGGQLLTEYNLKSRESVATDPEISYFCGPSYKHSESDFQVTASENDPTGTIVISSGRGLVNGHYVELMNDIEISMVELKAKLDAAGQSMYSGDLCVGIRAVYSTETTLAGSMLPEFFETEEQAAQREAQGHPAPEGVGMYSGLHIVILPISQFKSPEDVPNNPEDVTVHLKLATFKYKHDIIITSSIKNFEESISFLEASRIKNIDSIISESYITSSAIDPKRMYVYSGKVDNQGNLKKGWCDATNSLMNWDDATVSSMEQAADASSVPAEAKGTARFETVGDKIQLRIPHKQIDGYYPTSSGGVKYYPAKVLSLPVADFLKATPGTVSSEFIRRMQNIENNYREIYTRSFGLGRLRKYIPTLSSREISTENLPSPLGSGWSVGDYVLVRNDETIQTDENAQPPSTLYPVIPGYVGSIEYYGTTPPSGVEIDYKEGEGMPSGPAEQNAYIATRDAKSDAESAFVEASVQKGTAEAKLEAAEGILDSESQRLTTLKANLTTEAGELSEAADSYVDHYTSGNTSSYEKAIVNATTNSTGTDQWNPAYKKFSAQETKVKSAQSAVDSAQTALKAADEIYNTRNEEFNAAADAFYDAEVARTNAVSVYNSSEYWDLALYHGVVNQDYFRYVDTSTGQAYYYIVKTNTGGCSVMYPIDESTGLPEDPIMLTGQVALATEDIPGAFYNVPDDATDYGYVRLDADGHLRLIDYDLLRSGTLAYQLGEDYEVPAGLTIEEIQNYLDNYINDRVAFPNANQYANHDGSDGRDDRPDVINLTITLPDEATEDSPRELFIRNIDSRFGASVYLHINGQGNQYTAIRISNCEKLRIDEAINSVASDNIPVIYLTNCNLYYSAGVLDKLISNGLPTTSGLKFWYERYYKSDGTSDDPEIEVDGMTIRSTSKSIAQDSIEGWTDFDENDNHYSCALKSITFNEFGTIVGASIYLADNTTNTTTLGKFAYASAFSLPQGSDLLYPVSRLLKPIKIDGTFLSTYKQAGSSTFIVAQNTFSALTQYTTLTPNVMAVNQVGTAPGTIVFRREVDELAVMIADSIDNTDVLDATESGQLTIFHGEAIY